ncbi:MAG: CbiX/SirB N-terminal domain-containing protein [Rhodoferax sp.]|uniref:sirohydrochlorin chelatase n=1 Tax=Rhodoferax sp. TaxID=50421 RepID=UPI00262924E7|nr:CbiX/SirB N-terminal domain-containing protein [Rhodoferax sp.]MDD5336567.1 CbiX/SirB N-terminal domain-containing protein [Rhodoferax sp.]
MKAERGKDHALLVPSGATHGIILLAHGSRDPSWQRPVEAVAQRIRQLAPATQVCCAYLEATAPDLPDATALLAKRGVASITVLPLFLGMGRHARDDLPILMTGLQANHPAIVFDLRPALGEEARMIELMAEIALS